MRILVLGDLSSFHTPRWVQALRTYLDDGEVYALSLEPFDGGTSHDVYLRPRVSPLKVRYLTAVDRVNRAIRKIQPDILNPIHLPNYGLLASFCDQNLPIYLHLWGSDILETAKKTPLHRLLSYHILHQADHIAVDAEVMKEVVVREFGYPADRVTVMTWGVPKPLRERPLRPWSKPEIWRIVSHRRFEPHMEPQVVLEAFARVLEVRQDVELIMASEGSLLAEMKAYAQTLGIADSVRFPGRLPEADLFDLLASGHLYVSASRMDSTSVSLLEAMALGLFPVVSDLPANREWVIDRFNGFLFPVGDAATLAHHLLEAMARPDFVAYAREMNKHLIQEKACWECHVRKAIQVMREWVWARSR